MMRLLSIVALACALIISYVPDLRAQDYIPIFSRDYSSRLSFEIDPITFIAKGHSLHVRYQPMFSNRLLVGLGTYGLDLPQYVVNSNSANRDRGWEVRISSAYALYGEMYLTRANHGWFLGEQVGLQSFRVSNNSELISGETRFNNFIAMTYLGYSWHPYKGSFYIKPWIGLGYTTKVDGVNRIGQAEYQIAPLFPFATFHAGYTF